MNNNTPQKPIVSQNKNAKPLPKKYRPWLIALAVLYIVSPIDFVPDVFVPVGFADDFVVLVLGIVQAVKMYRERTELSDASREKKSSR